MRVLRWVWIWGLFSVPLVLTGLLVPGGGARNHTVPVYAPVEQVADSAAACGNVAYSEDDVVTPPALSEELPHFVIPPHLDGPTLVDLGLYIVGITDINPAANTFTLEGFLDLVWCDPRHRFDAAELGWDEQVYLEEVAIDELGFIWWPDVTFPNEKGSRERESESLIIFEDGTVEYEERFSATLEANYDLTQFPFDRQQLVIEIESLAWSEQYLHFHMEDAKIGFSEDFELPEWDITGVSTQIEDVQEIRDDEPFSEFLMTVDVERRPGFYLWKVFLPLILIVMLSWSVFWTLDEPLPDSLAISFTGVLTVVAYQFVLGDSLPRIPYLTFMDAVLTFSFVLMVATIGENILVHMLLASGRRTTASRIEVASRVVFPVVYVIVLAILVVQFGVYVAFT